MALTIPLGFSTLSLRTRSSSLWGSKVHNCSSIFTVQTPLKCLSDSATYEPAEETRRTAKYQPNKWDYDFVHNIPINYYDEAYTRRVEKLKEEAKCTLLKLVEKPLAEIELIDTLQRLGIGHLFYDEIHEALKATITCNNLGGMENDLYGISTWFRLLRQYGYHVSQDVFNIFKNERGNLKSYLCEDIKGMISLYEASHLAFQGETLMDECRAFSTAHLKALNGNLHNKVAKVVEHALELPLHWRLQRTEALWNMNIYEGEEHMDYSLLELAKLDFNMLQAVHQRDLKEASRWWRNLGLQGKLSFSRDRLMECFFFAMGVASEPQFEYCRVELAKVCQLITTIDDMYDVFGSLYELELFTDAIDRWDAKSMEQLPEYMMICFLALMNTTNEMGYKILQTQGVNIIPCLHKAWADLCKSMLLEAKWYCSGHRPTLQEYLDNGWISSSGPVILIHALLSMQTTPREVMDGLNKYPKVIQCASMIFRLCNDLGTYRDEKNRGDARPSSVDCYMNEANVSETDACNHIRDMIFDMWSKLNEEMKLSDSCQYVNFALNLARTAHCIYLYGDGHTVQDQMNRERLNSLLIHPITLKEDIRLD